MSVNLNFSPVTPPHARAHAQALRGTLENAAALAAGLPPDTPAVLATLPKGKPATRQQNEK
jgi:hypothetical protein